MEIDPIAEEEEEFSRKAEALGLITTTGPLPASISKLSGSSRGIPSQKDFFFYNNFEKFKSPVKEMDQKSTTLLQNIGASSQLWGKQMAFPEGLDCDDLETYDWLVNTNDDIYEKLDASLEEFRRKEGEGSGGKMDVESESGFQLVHGKKNRKRGEVGGKFSEKEGLGVGLQVTVKAKPKVSFHIPSIPRPQDEYKIIVNNSNQPFEHVWLQRSEDGSRFVHPLEKVSVRNFVDKINNIVPVKPLPLESTPFKLVEEVKDLKQLAAKLHSVDEFAVDLEHNQYRSFQGLTCLMQISTRTEDFVIDALKLRIHIGPYLREVFKDPTKKKVMHGADRDIVWLQRDFGIYVCNLFDTGQASRVLKLERFSLEYLLYHFCAVTANKEYQNADWRLRPLPNEMLRYSREDTHYLLYIYDLMRLRLLSASSVSESSDAPLIDVYKRSYDICMQLYEKELLTDSSYLHVYGLQGAGLTAQQLAVVAGLCEWRDVVARAEDESTGYVLPNKTLIEIAKQMPLTTSKLRQVVKSKHPYIERNLGSVVSIIRHSLQNAPAFEVAVEQLREKHMERASEKTLATEVSEVLLPEASEMLKNVTEAEDVHINISHSDGTPMQSLASSQHEDKLLGPGSLTTHVGGNPLENLHEYLNQKGNVSSGTDATNPRVTCNAPEHIGEHTGATVQALKKPSRAFGALLGSSTRRKLNPDKKKREDMKLEQIKSTVNLPFHSFLGTEEQLQGVVEEPAKPLDILHRRDAVEASPNSEDIILLGGGSDVEVSINGGTETANDGGENREDDGGGFAPEMEDGEKTMSLSDLSSSFQECFQSVNQTRKSKAVDNSQGCEGFLQLKPFDYEAAKAKVKFGEDRGGQPCPGADEGGRSRLQKGDRKNSSVTGRSQKDELPQGKRRQAFPPSGNRSATFR